MQREPETNPFQKQDQVAPIEAASSSCPMTMVIPIPPDRLVEGSRHEKTNDGRQTDARDGAGGMINVVTPPRCGGQNSHPAANDVVELATERRSSCPHPRSLDVNVRSMLLEQAVDELIGTHGLDAVSGCVKRRARLLRRRGTNELAKEENCHSEEESSCTRSQSSLFGDDNSDSSNSTSSFLGGLTYAMRTKAQNFLRKTRGQLRTSERVRRGVLEASFDPIFCVSESGIIVTANRAAEEQFGWTHEEFMGQNISIIVSGGHAENHDKYMQNYLRTGKKCVMGKKRELLARRKDGSEFPLELGLTEIKTQSGDERMFCGFIRDLTRQKKYEGELKRQINISKGIIEASFDAMFAIDDRGIIQMVNQASVDKFGWSRDEFVGRNITMIMESKEHADNHDRYLRNYVETGIKKMMGTQREVRAKRKDGKTFPVMLGLSEVVGQEDDGSSSHLFVGFIRDLTDEKEKLEMEIEKAEAEALLLNMLPENIALRLREDPSHIADHYPSTTILFADIVGFTTLSHHTSPVDLVSLLNDLFSRFDMIVDRYDLNKVKTIGDCYMVTSVPDTEHQAEECSHVCHFALDMLEELDSFNRDRPGRNLSLRVGVNTGPVVAGVVGTKRFMYDVFGDAVNIASRMESTGVPGKIQVTRDVVDIVPGREFNIESRGKIHVKGKGDMETFFLKGRNRVPVMPARPPQTSPPRLLRRVSAPLPRTRALARNVGSRSSSMESKSFD